MNTQMERSITTLIAKQTLDLSSLKKVHLLIDTNFLIDSIKNRDLYKQIFDEFKKNECTLVSIDAVFYEFTRGTRSLEEYKKKVDFYSILIHSTLPTNKLTNENVSNLNKVLLKRAEHLSYIDALLLGTLMLYDSEIYLLTKDRSDISTDLFPIKLSFIIENDDSNRFFSIYDFDKKNYLTKLEKFVEK